MNDSELHLEGKHTMIITEKLKIIMLNGLNCLAAIYSTSIPFKNTSYFLIKPVPLKNNKIFTIYFLFQTFSFLFKLVQPLAF